MKWLFVIGLVCLIQFNQSSASNIECSSKELKEKYFQRHGGCYGYENSECADSTDCLSTGYSCYEGNCIETDSLSWNNITFCSIKYGKSVCWLPNKEDHKKHGLKAVELKFGGAEYICRVEKDGQRRLGKLVDSFFFEGKTCKYIWKGKVLESKKYEFLNDPEAVWKSEGVLMDRAIFGGFAEDGKPNLICRAYVKKLFPKLHGKGLGQLSPPNYDKCTLARFGNIFNRTDFEVLVRK